MSTVTKAKYARKSAAVNRSLIKNNAYAIKKLYKLIPKPLYTDYQYTTGLAPFFGDVSTPYFTIRSAELMNPFLWNPVLRQDVNVLESSSTLVKRMSMNMRYTLGASDWCQITVFVVSVRKDAADRIIGAAGLVENEDYIFSGASQQLNPRLNPAVMKVHYTRDISLAASAWLEDKTLLTNPGGQGTETNFSNAQTTFAKGQVNMKLNFHLKQPNSGNVWKNMDQNQLSPYQRLSLLVFFRGKTAEVDDNPPRVDFDALYTCYNSG